MEHPTDSRLIKLSALPLPLESVDQDVRGRRVQAVDGEEIGIVDDLLLDARERTVRFLEVATRGFPGIGIRKTLLPVEAVFRLDDLIVYIEHSSDDVAAAPIYNPHVVQTNLYLTEIYEHYGYRPPWAPEAETE